MTSTTDTTTPETILVVGATGRTGRHIVDGLLTRGAHVRALVRNPSTAALPAAVDVRRGDLDDPASVGAAADGAAAAFLLWHTFASEGAAEVVGALAHQVGHIVYLSAADAASGGPMPGIWAELEALIDEAPVTRTFVRGGGFAVNTLGWAEQIRSGDIVRLPFPRAARPLVDERDLAEVAVRGLLDPDLAGAAPAITGPEPLTQEQQVHTIGAAIGRDLSVQEQPAQEARQDYRELMGDDFADQAIDHWAALVDQPEQASHDIEQVLGRPARSFAEWAEFHADDFRAPRSA